MEPRKRKASSTQMATSERATRQREMKGSDGNRDFEVFLNFQGPDIRHTVADVLYHALAHAGVRVFLHDEETQRGDVIGEELSSAIADSRIYIPIFSRNYASSQLCLRELQKMVECWRNSSGSERKKVILPIFYDVEVGRDLKLGSDVYLASLQKHRERHGDAAVEPWEAALKEVATISGWNLKDHGLVGLADLIKKEVLSSLSANEALPAMPYCLIGIHDKIEAIMQLLDEESPDVRFIVIHGAGGIGKTTLAKSVFKKISANFQGSCILPDIRRSSNVDDIVKLQQKLSSDTLNLGFINVSSISDGIDLISKRLREKKVLIILDDVDKRDHLLSLAAKSDWFGPKSRIVITTRNIDFLLPIKDNNEYCFYEMKEMDPSHALELFCRHAFKSDSLPCEYYDISIEIVANMVGLPLVVQVIGSSLYNQDDETWKFRLEKLKTAPHNDVQQVLMISYQALEYEQQQIFLDIACFFNDKEKTDPIYFWKACNLYPDSGIKILIGRSLIKVDDDDKLWMHDQLRDLGRAIAKYSRLWSPKVAYDVVQKRKVAKSIIAVGLGTLDARCRFVHKEFARPINLKFLQLQGGNFEGDFENVLQQLRWLSWVNCPLKIEATNLSFKNLVVLKLSRSQITQDWSGWGPIMMAKQLKVLRLIDCTCLKKTLDFSAFLGLERLSLEYCWKLEEIDRSITELKYLDYLEISNKFYLDGSWHKMPRRPQLLPDSIGVLMSLTVLKIDNAGLTALPTSIKELKNLKHLCLRDCHLEKLPSFIGKLVSLVELDISYSGIKELPNSIGKLKQLKILRIADSAISYLPNSIGGLESLNELHMWDTKITMLPETIGNLKSLKVLELSMSSIRNLPKALGKLENLEELHASCCADMDAELPKEIGKLSRLRILNLENTKVSRLPATINQLSHIQKTRFG